ncbi:hypothetical protein [Ralstonia pseudosolanacearum]
MKNGRYEVYGSVRWYWDDELHREDGPAFEGAFNEWYLNGKKHREDGPSLELDNGYKEWWLNGVELTEEEFNQWLMKKALNEKLQSLSHKPIIKRGKI